MVFPNPFQVVLEFYFHEKAYSLLSTMGEGSSTTKINPQNDSSLVINPWNFSTLKIMVYHMDIAAA